MTTRIFFASLAFFIFESSFAFLFWSFFLCICIFANDIFTNQSITQNFRFLYEQHQQNQISQKCAWFVQTKRAQENYLMWKHESKIKNKLKQKAKKLMKQQKKIRLVKKRTKKYTCRRCKTIKFDNNIKFHEHIRIRHVKKSKTVVSFFLQISKSIVSFSTFSVSSFESIIFSSLASSKLIVESLIEFSFEISSEFLSIATSKKSISWAEIVSRSIVAFKFSRFSIATFKSMCKMLKNANIVCSFTSSRTFTSSRFYLIVNDLYHMFVEKSSFFDLQRHQMRFSFSKIVDKNNCKSDFIQTRITSYFHAMILSVFKSIKFEAFASIHVSIKHSIRMSFSRIFRFFSSSMRFFLSKISRSFFVCKHCQERFVIYWFIDWIMSNVSKIENNEILMKQRYWSFVSFRSILKKYWFFYLEKIITLRKSTCCLFVLFAHLLLLIVDRFEKTKSCCCCFNEFDVSFLSRSVIWKSFKSCCMLCLFVYCFTNL